MWCSNLKKKFNLQSGDVQLVAKIPKNRPLHSSFNKSIVRMLDDQFLAKNPWNWHWKGFVLVLCKMDTKKSFVMVPEWAGQMILSERIFIVCEEKNLKYPNFLKSTCYFGYCWNIWVRKQISLNQRKCFWSYELEGNSRLNFIAKISGST